MIQNKTIIVVMPAYNAERTLRATYNEISHDYIDEVILVDDSSTDRTAKLAREMGIKITVHHKNMGYGANQKTCYRDALRHGADIVVMLHPDYQYTPKLLVPMAAMVSSGLYDAVIGSRVLSDGALKGGMPLYKYISNRCLTFIQNMLLNQNLSEYHTGYRAFSRKLIETLPLAENSNDFIFDNQMLAQALYFGFRIGEISCPTHYFKDASSISFWRSVKYGFGVIWTSLIYRFQKMGLIKSRLFNPDGKTLRPE